ncbi:MAG: phosphate signaling complex protein PhoU [Chitinispirillaceae bacterium]|nr:phosphate signaling complex protein PhoU [Chitinispirillaceae bacterium]
MAKHLQRELDALQKQLLSLASIVEEQLTSAVRSVEKKDAPGARRIIEFDRNVDLLEVEVEEECLKLLALHQPVAIDLRFIIAVLKINNDLERIGDLAGNIAERAIALAVTPSFTFTSKLPLMCEKAVTMLRQSLDSLFKMDIALAKSVCKADGEVDDLYRDMIGIVRDGIVANTERVDEFLLIMSVSRHLERIADHATNIAEDVIYMIEGDIVRHNEARMFSGEVDT